MGQRLWWGALAGAMAGLAMLACAVGLAGLGQPDCVRPILALALPAPSGTPPHPATGLLALAPGALLHEGVAMTLGLLVAWIVAPLMRPLAMLVALVGGAASMAALDAAVLAARAPAHMLMLDGPQSLEYLVFGLVLAICMVTGDTAGALVRRSVAAALSERERPAAPVARAAPSGGGQAAHVHPPTVLEIVITPHCFGCARARTLAATIAAHDPALDVRVVDLSEPDVQAPPGLVAVPSYVLNGRILFIGNPTQATLAAALRTADRTTAGPPDTP
ncbi:MAG: hypothetical protein LC769_07680 [Chloroflexi bacterium]|nr:hypothetical protein [Chloroflexota bacterium]